MISILLPTTGRPDMAERCVRSLVATTEGHDIELCTAIDADPETFECIEKALPVHVEWRGTYEQEHRGCSRAWNDCLALATGDPIVLAGDDLIWRSGWLEAALAKLAEFDGGWGLVGFNDGHWGAELSTHYLMSRRFIVEVLGGVVAWEGYKHSFNDREANVRAKKAGRYAWAENARVDHEHWLFGDRPQDETDTRNLPDHPVSQRIYRQREFDGFPNGTPVITS